jgi:hypothetical protein
MDSSVRQDGKPAAPEENVGRQLQFHNAWPQCRKSYALIVCTHHSRRTHYRGAARRANQADEEGKRAQQDAGNNTGRKSEKKAAHERGN